MSGEPTIPAQDATVTVNYWTLDCVLDWVMHHMTHHDTDWSCEKHYEELQAALAPADAGRAVGMTVPNEMILRWRRVVNFSLPRMTDKEWQKELSQVMREMSELTHDLRMSLHWSPATLTNQQPAAPTSDGATGGEEQ